MVSVSRSNILWSRQNSSFLTICCSYSCSLLNNKIHDWLLLLDTPEGTTLSTSAAGNTVTQGGSVTFTCHVTAAKPQVSRYRFYLNDTTLVKDSNDRQYTINNVQRSQHYGKYKCVPRNDVGNGPEMVSYITVWYTSTVELASFSKKKNKFMCISSLYM